MDVGAVLAEVHGGRGHHIAAGQRALVADASAATVGFKVGTGTLAAC